MDQVQCPNCHVLIRLSERVYGKKFRCRCGIKIQMPSAPMDAIIAGPDGVPLGRAKSVTEPKTFDLTQASESSRSIEQTISFQCPRCFRLIQVPDELAGYVSRCTCGIKVRIPQ